MHRVRIIERLHPWISHAGVHNEHFRRLLKQLAEAANARGRIARSVREKADASTWAKAVDTPGFTPAGVGAALVVAGFPWLGSALFVPAGAYVATRSAARILAASSWSESFSSAPQWVRDARQRLVAWGAELDLRNELGPAAETLPGGKTDNWPDELPMKCPPELNFAVTLKELRTAPTVKKYLGTNEFTLTRFPLSVMHRNVQSVVFSIVTCRIRYQESITSPSKEAVVEMYSKDDIIERIHLTRVNRGEKGIVLRPHGFVELRSPSGEPIIQPWHMNAPIGSRQSDSGWVTRPLKHSRFQLFAEGMPEIKAIAQKCA